MNDVNYVQQAGRVTQIVAAFPGCGKTTYYYGQSVYGPDEVIDSDSSNFSWATISRGGKRFRNPDFPQNYLDHIEANVGKKKVILISSHQEVRDALHKAGIWYFLVYPDIDSKKEYIERYVARKTPSALIDLIDKNWEEWVTSCQNQQGCGRWEIPKEKFLSDIMPEIRELVGFNEFHPGNVTIETTTTTTKDLH